MDSSIFPLLLFIKKSIFFSKFIEAILNCKYKTSDNERVKLGNFVDITTLMQNFPKLYDILNNQKQIIVYSQMASIIFSDLFSILNHDIVD